MSSRGRAKVVTARRGQEKSENPEASRIRVAKLLTSRDLPRRDQHKDILIRRFLLLQAARNQWDYIQAACRWGCSCLDVVKSVASHADLGIAQDNAIFVIKPAEESEPS